MKRILVPIDFSDFSMNAVEVACYIAKVKDLAIKILHVVEDSYTPYYNMVGMSMIEDDSLVNYRRDLQQSVREQLIKLTDKIKEKNLSVEADVIIDRPYKGILNHADDPDIELIVMGSHGHGDIEDVFLGSTTEKVIRLSPVPVLTVQDVRQDFKIDKIVFASNFEEAEVEPIVQRVIRFAEIFMAELFLVRVNTASKVSESSARQRLEEFAKKFGLNAGAVNSYQDRSEEEGIVNYAKEIQADLIAMCTHGRSGLSRFFKTSVAEEVVGFSEVPVLTYNISKERVNRGAMTRDRKIKLDTTTDRATSNEE